MTTPRQEAATTYYAPSPRFGARQADTGRRVALALIAILAVVLLFDLTASGALARIAGPDGDRYGWAMHELALREAPRMTAPRVQMVRPGTKLKLIDSAGGEILDPAQPAPSKWYLVKPADGGEVGWVYSGWIRR
ncbi:MAG: SH3 domain-containing protein [Chloroflexi bacterium]|nr:SH3 domain-containing protein [Chloroflexota bacterium]GIW10110.1 MAG: hypothetical protein KatS3mg061_1167 [Dehalococcoidia bacterium]